MIQFLYRLALQTGNWNIRELAEKMTTEDIIGWLGFYRTEPFGDDWRRSGRLAAITVAASGAKAEGELEEKFMPGGGIYRGRNEAGAKILDELRKIPGFKGGKNG